MKIFWGAIAAGVLVTNLSARAAVVTVIAAGGIEAALNHMTPGFKTATGHDIKVTYGPGGTTKNTILGGERFDVVIVQSPYPEMLNTPHVDARSETPLGSIQLAVVVRKDAPRPDISTPSAVKKMLLDARLIVYPNPASGADAGLSFNDTLARLGIAATIAPKTRLGEVYNRSMAILARGEADIGVTYITEVTEPGVEVVGPLPLEISTPTALTAFLAAKPIEPAAARALVNYMSRADAIPLYKSLRMLPPY
ncbi:MAG: substrate-binding domain-containing protein [Rhodospirillaceae bacterium]|nr:substrate-binding domain-containing protein [Rhodospirillaceae bacterium]